MANCIYFVSNRIPATENQRRQMDTEDLVEESQMELTKVEADEKSTGKESPQKCDDCESSNDSEWADHDVDKSSQREALGGNCEDGSVHPLGAVGGVSEEAVLDSHINPETSDVAGIDRLLQRHKK